MKEYYVNLDVWKLHLERETWKRYSTKKEPHYFCTLHLIMFKKEKQEWKKAGS